MAAGDGLHPLGIAAIEPDGEKQPDQGITQKACHFQIGRFDGRNGLDVPLLEKMAAKEVKLVPGRRRIRTLGIFGRQSKDQRIFRAPFLEMTPEAIQDFFNPCSNPASDVGRNKRINEPISRPRSPSIFVITLSS